MVTVQIICVGKLKEDYLVKACGEYIKRLGAYAKTSVIEIDEFKLPQNPSKALIEKGLETEGGQILKKIPPKSFTFALCIEGRKLDSPNFSQKINDAMLSGRSAVNFVIGSSYGLSDGVKNAADFKLSMSDMTFPHQLARVMLLEQIYRSFQIMTNGRYHK